MFVDVGLQSVHLVSQPLHLGAQVSSVGQGRRKVYISVGYMHGQLGLEVVELLLDLCGLGGEVLLLAEGARRGQDLADK